MVVLLVIIALALCIIIATVVAVVYSHVKKTISREKYSQNISERHPMFPKEKKPLFPAQNGLYVNGVSSQSLLLVFLAAERGIPVTLLVSKDPESLALAFSHKVADFVKRNYECESVYDMIASLPESVVVIPEENSSSLPDTGIRVDAVTIKDPFFMADSLFGKSDAVILVKHSCTKRKSADDFDII